MFYYFKSFLIPFALFASTAFASMEDDSIKLIPSDAKVCVIHSILSSSTSIFMGFSCDGQEAKRVLGMGRWSLHGKAIRDDGAFSRGWI